MTTYITHKVCFLLLTSLVPTTFAQDISDPYFFQNKTQRCNCEPNSQCDNDTGVCSPNLCAQPYLGVNCQHADVNLAMSDPPKVPPELLDGDDRTCLTSPWDGKVVYKLEEPTHFIWAFVSRHECEPMQPNIVLYNKDVKLDVQTYFLRIHPHSLLIKTRQDVMYTRLELSNLPDDTCSVEVSLGRNLALSAAPEISSVYSKIPKRLRKSHAYRAIDGNDNSTFTKTSQCIHTKVPKRHQAFNSWWRATLHSDARINAVLIVNRGFRQCRMWDSVFKIFAPNTTEVARYNIGRRSSEKSIYTFQMTPVLDSIRKVEIFVSMKTGLSCTGHGTLNLCEVYVYGEFRCSNGTYGARCERSYPAGCSPEQCDPDWGCPRGCKVDIDASCTTNCSIKYGEVCELLCSKNCKGDGRCARYTGECLEGCKLGFYKPNCTVPCLAGYFGKNCEEHCVNCKKDNITDQHQCDRESGVCLDGCADGYAGDDCERIPSESWFSFFGIPWEYILAVLLALLLLICLLLCCCRRCAKTKKKEEEDVDESTNVRSQVDSMAESDLSSARQHTPMSETNASTSVQPESSRFTSGGTSVDHSAKTSSTQLQKRSQTSVASNDTASSWIVYPTRRPHYKVKIYDGDEGFFFT